MTGTTVPARPKKNESAVVKSAKAAIRMAIDAPGVMRQHRKHIISEMLWKITEARFPKHKLEFRTLAVIQEDCEVQHEHVWRRAWIVEEILAAPNKFDAIVKKYAVGCVVTAQEAKRLNAQDRARPDLRGWDRYAELGIPVVRVDERGDYQRYRFPRP